MKYKVHLALIAALVTLLPGCSTIRNGGAPDPSFDINKDLEQLSKEYESATNITNFYKTPIANRVDARNRFMSGRLVQIDLQYLRFIRTLTSDKQQLDAAADIASLSLNLAGTLVGGANAKTNLAAAAAGIGGVKTTIDKDFYYEKSIEALVATMNARRKEVLIQILTGLSSSIEQYPFERAIIDLQQYYLAGTLNGAVQFINTRAAESEAKSDKTINVLYKLPVPTESQVNEVELLTDAIGSPSLTIDQAKLALRALGVAEEDLPEVLDDSTGKNGLKSLLKYQVRKAMRTADDDARAAAIKKVTEAFKEAGMIK